jgi:hypothetical protein
LHSPLPSPRRRNPADPAAGCDAFKTRQLLTLSTPLTDASFVGVIDIDDDGDGVTRGDSLGDFVFVAFVGVSMPRRRAAVVAAAAAARVRSKSKK